MAEVKFKVQTFLTDYICDECGTGDMLPNGTMKTSLPPLYTHVCEACGAEKDFSVQYPYLTREKV